MLYFQKLRFWEILRTNYSNNAIKSCIHKNSFIFIEKYLTKKSGGGKMKVLEAILTQDKLRQGEKR